jgi:hypothetical protein
MQRFIGITPPSFYEIPNRRNTILSELPVIDSAVAASCWRVCRASSKAPSALESDLTRSSAPDCSVTLEKTWP